jgi:predicted small secreted protein
MKEKRKIFAAILAAAAVLAGALFVLAGCPTEEEEKP